MRVDEGGARVEAMTETGSKEVRMEAVVRRTTMAVDCEFCE
jgi:hypothetical protein